MTTLEDMLLTAPVAVAVQFAAECADAANTYAVARTDAVDARFVAALAADARVAAADARAAAAADVRTYAARAAALARVARTAAYAEEEARQLARLRELLAQHQGFGAYIRQKREAKGIQMNDFARQLDISPAYWSRIERDMEKPPKDELIRKAAEILGENVDDAFVEASRLPPDMRDDVGGLVRMYRKQAGDRE